MVNKGSRSIATGLSTMIVEAKGKGSHCKPVTTMGSST